VAVLGGGNGIFAVLRGLGRAVAAGANLDVKAVIATADDGGSSGRIRRARGGIPPGDLRNALLALSPEESTVSSLFSHRFGGDGEVGGHALGNLILLALAESTGCYVRALDEAGRLLGSRGSVLPATREPVILLAETRAGGRLDGESVVGRCRDGIARVWLEPAAPAAPPEAVRAIEAADLVIVGPGSLFTSLLPVLLVPSIGQAVRAARGRKVLVANLMTQRGETVGMDLNGHLEVLDAHLGAGLFQDVLVHRGSVEPERLAPYAEEGAARIGPSVPAGRPEVVRAGDLLCSSGKIRHDPDRTAAMLLRLATERKKRASVKRRISQWGAP
jgi:uncharacterized cofD-like protein